MDYPEYVEANGKRYKINTDFRVAIECEEIAQSEVNEYEKVLAIIYKLFGDEGLEDFENHEELVRLGQIYLLCGKEPTGEKEEQDMDFIQDYGLIKASFRSDYNINLDDEKMHWYEFCDLMNGLSESELGNSCVLNRVRNLRTMDISKINNPKERAKIQKMQEKVALRKKKKKYTEQQIKSMEKFYNQVNRKE